MQSQHTEALTERLERLELSHRSSSTKVEGLLPTVEDFLQQFSGSTEVQLAALSKGLGEVGEAVSGLLGRQGNSIEPTGCSQPDAAIPILQMEVESLRRATENLPQAYLKLKNEFQTWGGGLSPCCPN